MVKRTLCPMNIPSETRADSADWCNKWAGHTGDHIARDGRRWSDADETLARSAVRDG